MRYVPYEMMIYTAFVIRPCGGPAHPLGAPARLVLTDIGALRLALRASRGGFASGALLSSGRSAKEGGNCVFACFPRARGRILADAPALTLARVLAHTPASAFAPSERGRAKVFGWHIKEDGTEGICVL